MLPQGLLSFPLTPFTPDNEVDLAVLSEHLEDQLAQDPAGIFAAAGAGEFTALSTEEYDRVVTRAVEVVNGRVPLFAGVGGGPAAARATTEIAEKAGIDGVLLLPPYLVASTPAGVVDHIRYVADSTKLPVVFYQRANAVLTPQAAVSLLDIPNVVGLKDGHGDIELVQKIYTAIRRSGHARANSFGFQNGQPTAELSAIAYTAIGVPGYSSAVLNFAPDIAKAFYNALTGGDRNRTEQILNTFYVPFAEIRDQVPGYAVSLIKAGVALRGLKIGSVRPPLVNAREEDVADLERLLLTARAELFPTKAA